MVIVIGLLVFAGCVNFTKNDIDVSGAADELGLSGHIACHSLRKAWGYNAWSRAKIRPEVIMMVYNHSSFAVTQRYLGTTQDDLDLAYCRMRMF